MTYSIEKHKPTNIYVLWQTIETEHGIGSHNLFVGTKKDCKKKLEEINARANKRVRNQNKRARGRTGKNKSKK